MEDELARLSAELAEIRDRQAIRDCIVRESRARDRQDTAQIESCWWPEGVDEHGDVVTPAPDYAARANAGHRALFTATSHNITNHLCTLDGASANCESYVVGALAWKDGHTSIAFGRYLDRLEKRGGEWRILVRRCTIEATADADGSWVRSDAVKGFLKPLWDGQDPSYDMPYDWKPAEEGVRW
jgi:hypothetical protein